MVADEDLYRHAVDNLRAGRCRRSAGKGLLIGGVQLPLALTELGLIDEYEFVHPKSVGHGPTLFAGLSRHVVEELGSGAVPLRYEPRR